MNRVYAASRTDVKTQWRNKLYHVGIGLGVLVAVMLAWLAPPRMYGQLIPSMMLAVLGSSTLMYVGGMIIFERDEGTLSATIVSPVRSWEYLAAKVLTLSTLATVEACIMFFGAFFLRGLSTDIPFPDLLPLLTGMIIMSVQYTLLGIILIVRYQSITQFLMPMAGVAVLLQLPIFYFLDWLRFDAFLAIPTSAPAVLIQGAFLSLKGVDWAYAIIYSLVTLVTLSILALRAFEKHVVTQGG